jgi:transposase
LIKALRSGSGCDLLERMAEPYPVVLRTRVVAAYDAGEGSYATLAGLYAVGSASVKRWVAQQRHQGHLEPKPKAGGTASTVSGAEWEEWLNQLGDPTAGELTAAYNRRRRGVSRVHVSSVKRALHRHDYVVNKNGAGRKRWSGQTSVGSGRTS